MHGIEQYDPCDGRKPPPPRLEAAKETSTRTYKVATPQSGSEVSTLPEGSLDPSPHLHVNIVEYEQGEMISTCETWMRSRKENPLLQNREEQHGCWINGISGKVTITSVSE